jgi:hypothetical protein
MQYLTREIDVIATYYIKDYQFLHSDKIKAIIC